MKLRQKYIVIVLLAQLIFCSVSKSEGLDNGRDSNDVFVVSEVLAYRCGVSSKDPALTEDCIRRLAYDYKTDLPPAHGDYETEKKAILNDYSAAYFYKAIVQMIASGDYNDRIDELIKQDPTISVSLDNDSREKMEFNNKLASDNSSIFLQAVDLRASKVNLENINNIVNNVVKETDVDTNDTALAVPPS